MLTLILVVLGVIMLGVIGMPIAFSFAIGTFVLSFAYDMSLTLAMRLSVDVLGSYAFLALPLYILMGNLVREFRIADRLIDMVNPLISNIKGGLAVVSIFVKVYLVLYLGLQCQR